MIQKILDATTQKTKIKIDYVDSEGERTTRIIRPYHVFKWHSNTYFMGFCEFDNDTRTFKIARIRRLEVLNNRFSDKILSLREYEALGHFPYFRHYPIRELKAAPQTRRQLDMPSTPYNVSSETIDFSQRKPYRFTSDPTYPSKHYSPKLVNSPATCRSPIEEKILTILDTDPKVRSYWIEPVRIPYIVGSEQHTYTPDILVEYTNGKKILVEIKASHDIDSVLNEMKFRAAELYCEEQGLRFIIFTLERGDLKVFHSWQEAVSSSRRVNRFEGEKGISIPEAEVEVERAKSAGLVTDCEEKIDLGKTNRNFWGVALGYIRSYIWAALESMVISVFVMPIVLFPPLGWWIIICIIFGVDTETGIVGGIIIAILVFFGFWVWGLFTEWSEKRKRKQHDDNDTMNT